MSASKISRRQLLRVALAGTTFVPVVSTTSEAADARLTVDDPKAKSLGYVEDAKQADAKHFANYRAGQACANCALIQQRYGFWRPCQLFPGKLISAKGWCSGWMAKGYP